MSTSAILTPWAFLRYSCRSSVQLFQKRTSHVTPKSTEIPHYHVMIVGGGVVGSTLALHLSKSVPGMQIALLHGPTYPKALAQLDKSLPGARAYALSPTSLKLLGDDLIQNLHTMGRVAWYDRMQIWESDGPAVLTFTARDIQDIQEYVDQQRPDNLGAVLEDELIVAGLWDALRERNNVTTIAPCNLNTIHLDDSKPSVTITYQHNNDPNKTSVISADVLVAADGANSLVRRQVGSFPIVSWSYGRRAITCTVRLTQSLNNTAFQRFQPRGPIALLPLANRVDQHDSQTIMPYANIVYSTTPEESRYLQLMNNSDFIHHINQRLQSGPAPAPSLTLDFFPKNIVLGIDRMIQNVHAGLTISGWNQRQPFITPPTIHEILGPRLEFDLNLMQATKYVSGRVVLVGDAAHTVHPMAGQGLNLGLADVESLSRYLKEAMESGMWDGNSKPSLLETYFLKRFEAERQRQVSLMQGGIQFLHGAFSTTFSPAVHVRSLGMNLVNIVSPIRRTCAKIATGMLGL